MRKIGNHLSDAHLVLAVLYLDLLGIQKVPWHQWRSLVSVPGARYLHNLKKIKKSEIAAKNEATSIWIAPMTKGDVRFVPCKLLQSNSFTGGWSFETESFSMFNMVSLLNLLLQSVSYSLSVSRLTKLSFNLLKQKSPKYSYRSLVR